MTSADIASSHSTNEPRAGQRQWERIRKRPQDYVGANLLDYDEYARTFSWDHAEPCLRGFRAAGSILPMRRLTAM